MSGGERRFRVEPGGAVAGRLRVPGDKSVSHRSVILGAIAEGETRVEGFLEGADTLGTAAAFRALGVSIEGPQAGTLRITGVGLRGLRMPDGPLDLGNAGTAMRLLPGVLAGQAFECELSGDASLCSRPMRRITEPLAAMGARVETAPGGTPPLRIRGRTEGLEGIDYRLPVASAQVKSCLLLAGLYASGRTCITEPAPSRDHTERMLAGFGWPVERDGHRVCVRGGARLTGTGLRVPGDISSAAFLLVAGLISPRGELLLEGVGVNPTRTGVIEILRRMGGAIEVEGERLEAGEPVADLRVRASRLRGIAIPEALVPLAIDEFPALFVAAACAEGETRLTGAAELRVKESDRIAVMAEGLVALGVAARPTEDGMVIQGGGGGRAGSGPGPGSALRGGEVDSHGDHRVAMAFAVAGLRSRGAIAVRDCANVDTSFPGFAALARRAGLRIEVQG
jgi:3-phosphoshikimate 1-carboxyvinyltransferase